jgi:hypothetical protein
MLQLGFEGPKPTVCFLEVFKSEQVVSGEFLKFLVFQQEGEIL